MNGAASLDPTRLIIGISGSSYASVMPQIIQAFKATANLDIRVIITESAQALVSRRVLECQLGPDRVHSGWEPIPGLVGAPHVALALWAEVVAIIPASNHTLGRLAHGLSTDLLTATCLTTRSPVLVAPSMAESMWEKPAVQRNIHLLMEDGIVVVPPGTDVSMTTGAREGGAVGNFTDPLFTLIETARTTRQGVTT